jgi:ABC-2 type transport system ATP-binding protein
MDEPTENMDPDNREVFYVILKKLKELNKTVLISTHNLAEIESKIDHAIVITNGTIQYCGEIKGKEHLRNIYDKYKPQEKKIEIEL